MVWVPLGHLGVPTFEFHDENVLYVPTVHLREPIDEIPNVKLSLLVLIVWS